MQRDLDGEADMAKRAGLVDALIEGERSGESRPFDFDVFLGEMRRLRSEARKPADSDSR